MRAAPHAHHSPVTGIRMASVSARCTAAGARSSPRAATGRVTQGPLHRHPFSAPQARCPARQGRRGHGSHRAAPRPSRSPRQRTLAPATRPRRRARTSAPRPAPPGSTARRRGSRRSPRRSPRSGIGDELRPGLAHAAAGALPQGRRRAHPARSRRALERTARHPGARHQRRDRCCGSRPDCSSDGLVRRGQRASRRNLSAGWLSRYRFGRSGSWPLRSRRDVRCNCRSRMASAWCKSSLKRGRCDLALYNEGQDLPQVGFAHARCPTADAGGLTVVAANRPTSRWGRWLERLYEGIHDGKSRPARSSSKPGRTPWSSTRVSRRSLTRSTRPHTSATCSANSCPSGTECPNPGARTTWRSPVRTGRTSPAG